MRMLAALLELRQRQRHAGQEDFSGCENAILTYEELREIVQDPTAYESWHTALSTVNAVYLI